MDCKHTINANPQQQLLRRCFSLDAVHKTFYINDKKTTKVGTESSFVDGGNY